jgi:Carboxypeptidase regulatory-like domain
MKIKSLKTKIVKFSPAIFVIAAAFFLMTALFGGRANAQTKQVNLKPRIITATKFDVSPPLRSIKPILSNESEKGEDERGEPGPVGDTRHDKDPVVQDSAGSGVFSSNAIPSTGVSFDGMTNTTGATPPDPTGDVGPNHYVQMVNSRFQIFSRTGTSMFGPANINTLFSGFGGPCQTENAGDPVVLYDQMADRWILTQFTANGPTFYNCIALSTTADPLGTYYRYAVPTASSSGNFPDYPKWGIWGDSYLLSTREFQGASGPFQGDGAYAMNRAQMLVGNPSPTILSFLLTPSPSYRTGDGILPSDVDGGFPPVGSPAYFVGSQDDGGPYGAPTDGLNLYKLHADWTTPANSTFTGPTFIPTAPFDSIFPCVSSARNCIPQPNTTVRLDILAYRQRPTFRLAYRRIGNVESLVTGMSVEATTAIAGMRWWEIRDPNGTPAIFQEGTYAPGTTDGIHRWMGSIAMDNQGNMGLGYSVSDATSVFPGIRYTGRLATDPAGTMPQGEGTIVNGGGSQTSSSNRWGDYSSMTVDPTDDCTFWYTNEYYPATSATTWRARVGSFKFPGCTAPLVVNAGLTGRVLAPSGRALSRVKVILSGPGVPTTIALTNSFGYYKFDSVPQDKTYIVTVASKQYTFTEGTKAFNVPGDVTNADFTSDPVSFSRPADLR